MFCPAGYTTLAELWTEFFAKYRVPLTRFAMEKYGQSDFKLGDTFGSPDDYCEDVFLSTLLEVPVFAAQADGRLMRIETASDAGRSNLFAKMSPLESFLAARNPAEAGEDGFWLRRMGSDHFRAWDGTAQTLGDWKVQFGGSDGAVSKTACFHTLPFAFERARYLVPDAPPPWICDVLDEHYLPRMIAAFKGCSLCVEDKGAGKWREQVLRSPNLPQLGDLSWRVPSSKGRPNKTEAILKAYRHSYPAGHSAPWKEVCRVLETKTGLKFSVKTLQRAVAMAANSAVENPD